MGRGAMNLSQKVALNTVLLVAGRAAIVASGLVGTILSTRYLHVDGFGQLMTALTFVAVFVMFTDLGVWTVTARELARRPDEEREVLRGVLTLGLLLSGAALVATVLVMLAVYQGPERHHVRLGILILASQLLVTAPGGVATAYTTAHQRAGPVALGALVSSCAFLAALGIVLGADLGFAGVASCYAISSVVNFLVPFLVVVRRVPSRPARVGALVRRLLRTALPQGAVLMVGVVYFRVDTVLLSVLGTDADVALYGVAYRVIEFLSLVPTYAMLTLFPEIARCTPRSPRLAMLIQGAFSASALALVPVVAVFLTFAPEIVTIAGGAGFAGAEPVLRILVGPVALTFVSVVFFQALVALDQQARLVRLLVVVLGCNVGLNAMLIPALHARGAAVALAASDAVLLVLGARAFARVGALPRLQRPVRLALAAAVAGGVAVGMSRLLGPGHPIATVFAGGAVTLVAYGAAAHLLRALPVEVTSAIAQLRSGEGLAAGQPAGT